MSGLMRTSVISKLWAVVLVIALAFCGQKWLSGSALQTSLFSMFPSDTQTEALDIALKHASKTFEHNLLVVLESDTRDEVKKTAKQLLTASKNIDDLEVVGAAQRFAFIETLFDYRQQLMTTRDRLVIDNGQSGSLTMTSIRRLYSPAGVSGQAFVDDPWQTFERYMLGIVGQNTFNYDDDLLIANVDGRYQALLQFTLGKSAFSSESLTAINALNQVLSEISSESLKHYRTGAGFYSVSAMSTATGEVSIIGGGALLLVVVVVLWVFANPKPLWMTLLSIAGGVISGLAATLLWFGEIHVLAMVMGSSLIGLSFDYSFHYLSYRACHQASENAAEKLRRALLAGVLSSSLAYSFLFLANLPVLNQMAVFSVFGLVGALATVLLWYPSIPQWRYSPRPSKIATTLYNLVLNVCRRQYFYGFVVLYAGVALYAFVVATTDDDVRLLQSPDPALVFEEQKIQSLTDNFGGSDWLITLGDSSEEVAQRQDVLIAKLDLLISKQQLTRYVAANQWVPSRAVQHENWLRYQRLINEQGERLAQMASLNHAPSINPFKALSNEQEFAGIPKLIGQLDDGRYFGLIQLSGLQGDFDETLLESGQYYINYVDDIGAMLGHYREHVSHLLLAAIGAVVLAMGVYFGWASLPKLMAAPLLAVVIAAALPAALGQPITLFHVLGLFLIFGIGIDYSVFLHCHGKSSHTVLAVFVAGVSSLLSFGLMALSSNYAIASFGLTVGLGILSSWLIAPMVLLNSLSEEVQSDRNQVARTRSDHGS